jgi:hypothetical protein
MRPGVVDARFERVLVVVGQPDDLAERQLAAERPDTVVGELGATSWPSSTAR